MIEEQEQVEISNIDYIKLYLKQELAPLLQQLKDIARKETPEPLESVKITNLSTITDALDKLEKSIQALEVNPVVNVPNVIVPEIKLPVIPTPQVYIQPNDVRVEAPIVNIDNSELLIALEPLSRLNELISVILTLKELPEQQTTFLEELARESNRNLSNISTAFSGGPSGMSKDEFKAAEQELYNSTTATNTFVTVGVASGTVLAANGSRKSAILTNDSDTTIYVSCGATAVLNRGIRLNASGGSAMISDYRGVISAISSGASKNLCVCEVY